MKVVCKSIRGPKMFQINPSNPVWCQYRNSSHCFSNISCVTKDWPLTTFYRNTTIAQMGKCHDCRQIFLGLQAKHDFWGCFRHEGTVIPTGFQCQVSKHYSYYRVVFNWHFMNNFRNKCEVILIHGNLVPR